MKKTFYSNGKLLITSEYLVLDGAIALALPTKFGQDLVVENGSNLQINWKSYDSDKTLWFDQNILFSEIKNQLLTNDNLIKNTLIKILHQAYLKNKNFIELSKGYNIVTNLSFPRNWGLGTSSTLINNIAQWLKIDAFELLQDSFGGSGYDIACAQNDTPILYHLENQKAIVKKIDYCPEFVKNIYFVYLNKKQNSREAIENYRKKNISRQVISDINNITYDIIDSKTLDSFGISINNHESLLSIILETETIKKQLFADFEGSIKSLGAWGGDFIMVASKSNPAEYFRKKGYHTILNYTEIIL